MLRSKGPTDPGMISENVVGNGVTWSSQTSFSPRTTFSSVTVSAGAIDVKEVTITR